MAHCLEIGRNGYNNIIVIKKPGRQLSPLLIRLYVKIQSGWPLASAIREGRKKPTSINLVGLNQQDGPDQTR
jgi:hypothetical protein